MKGNANRLTPEERAFVGAVANDAAQRSPRGGRSMSETPTLESIEAQIRQLHYYGNPPDARLQDDVDGDVEGIMEDVRELMRAAWEERDRARELVPKAYRDGWAQACFMEGAEYFEEDCEEEWAISKSKRALTPPGEGETDA